MITYNEALVQVLQQASPLGIVEKPLDSLLGSVLAESVRAPFPMPQFDNSAVDGFGVLAGDLLDVGAQSPKRLKLIGEIQAGSEQEFRLEAGCAIKILTGAMVPPSVEAVVMREYCREVEDLVHVEYSPKMGENIRRQGEEFLAGAAVLNSGVKVTPPVVGLLASLGYATFNVFAKPRLALITTGDELVEPGKPLNPGQIYNSNAYALRAALKAFGIEEISSFHARDSAEITRSAFACAMAQADVIISTGGVSVGDYDYVKDVLESLGVRTIFWKIAIKPGKPVYFGVRDCEDGPAKLIFGLPGNPISALVTYHQFVKPALLRQAGLITPVWHRQTARLSRSLKKKPGRLDFVRAVAAWSETGQLQVVPTTGQDSHMLSGLAKANSLIHFDSNLSTVDADEEVPLEWLSWSD
jgi:molybdopterin molybdotransferase